MANNYSGVEKFPATENETLKAIETIAKQEITNVKSTNRLIDAIYYDEVEEGTVIEQAVLEKAEAVTFDKDRYWAGGKPVDPKLVVRYFRNWETKQYETAIRNKDIRAIIAKNGNTTVESVTAGILDTLTQKEGEVDFENTRGLILNSVATDYASVVGGNARNMDGVIYLMRDMFNAIRFDTTGYSIVKSKQGAEEDNIRIAVSDKLLNLMDVTKLANIFNLDKAKLFGKLVPMPVDDLPISEWFKVVVYDRKRFNRFTRLFDYDQDKKQPGQFIPAILTTERAYFESPLYKAVKMDFTAAAKTELAKLVGDVSDLIATLKRNSN